MSGDKDAAHASLGDNAAIILTISMLGHVATAALLLAVIGAKL